MFEEVCVFEEVSCIFSQVLFVEVLCLCGGFVFERFCVFVFGGFVCF